MTQAKSALLVPLLPDNVALAAVGFVLVDEQ